MKDSSPNVFFFTALDCEASPLIRRFGLKKTQQPHPFSVYTGEKQVLVVSGVGKNAMAGAVAYTMAIFPRNNPILINLGIAGHESYETGTLLLANKIIDAENNRKKFYPHFTFASNFKRLTLCTLAKPDFEYRNGYLYDMEGVAFFEIAVKFSIAELIHCVKIVSDNRLEAAESINAKSVSDWVERQMVSIETIADKLNETRQRMIDVEPESYRVLIERYHFSVSAKIRLKTLLMRWNSVSDNAELPFGYAEFDNAKQLLKRLEREIDNRPFYL